MVTAHHHRCLVAVDKATFPSVRWLGGHFAANLHPTNAVQGLRDTVVYKPHLLLTVIALTLHANFIRFINQLDNTFFLTLFPLPQDFHDNHEIPEAHIHFSDNTTNAYD